MGKVVGMHTPPRPELAPGDILFGRPLFRDRPANSKHLHKDEHPVLVLRVACEEGNLRKTAILGVPISTSPICAQNPHALRARPGLIKGLAGKYDRDSWFCADSPNLIYINAHDSGLRHNHHPEPNWHRLKHGGLTDERVVGRVFTQMYEAMQLHNYKTPRQGRIEDIERGELAPSLARRANIVHRAAEMETAVHASRIPSLADAHKAATRPKLGLATVSPR